MILSSESRTLQKADIEKMKEMRGQYKQNQEISYRDVE
jgi:hypothetical protein